jgi:ABC-2 type transport system permease protein
VKNKTAIVFSREYLQRLKSKGFIISTILAPLALFAAIMIPILTTVLLEDDTQRLVYVVDRADLDLDRLDLSGDVEIRMSDLDEDSLRSLVLGDRIDGYLHFPAGITTGTESGRYVSQGGGGLQFIFDLERSVEKIVREARLVEAGVGESVLEIIDSEVHFESIRLTEHGEGADATAVLSIVGYVMAMIIYVAIFLYGSLVMRSVIEEKTNRVVEIVVSSVRPFQLMLGKVLGVGAVGLTQLLIWIIATFALITATGLVLTSLVAPSDLASAATGAQAPTDVFPMDLPEIPFSFFVYFILFFLGGYLLYASLFATIGSVVEQESDAQQFMLPIALPIVLSLLFLGRIIESPDSTLSIVTSYIPLFSPILMPVRGIVAPLAVWEMPLALVILFATFAGTVWFCARVYRVGILMYGKRPRFSDIVKWARMA